MGLLYSQDLPCPDCLGDGQVEDKLDNVLNWYIEHPMYIKQQTNELKKNIRIVKGKQTSTCSEAVQKKMQTLLMKKL